MVRNQPPRADLKVQSVSEVSCRGVWREYLLNELEEAAGVERGVHGRYGQGIELDGFVGVLDLLGHVVLLQNVDYAQVEDNVVGLVERLLLRSRDLLRPCWHVDAELDLEPVNEFITKIRLRLS